jgi:hypothetical protein
MCPTCTPADVEYVLSVPNVLPHRLLREVWTKLDKRRLHQLLLLPLLLLTVITMLM